MISSIGAFTSSDQQWLKRQSFAGKTGQVAWLENGAVVGSNSEDSLSTLGHLPFQLPEGVYQLTEEAPLSPCSAGDWAAIKFDRYKAG